jgi:hypothetical protein
MSKDLDIEQGGNLPAIFGTRSTRGLERRTRYRLSEIVADAGLRQARAEATADIEMTKVSAIGSLGQRAMAEQVKLSQTRKALAADDAELESSLAGTQQVTMVLMQSLLLDSARRISRIK